MIKLNDKARRLEPRVTECIMCKEPITYQPIAMAPKVAPNICSTCTLLEEEGRTQEEKFDLYGNSGISMKYSTFKTFTLDEYTHQRKAAIFVDNKVTADDYRAPYLFGTPGSGKTYLALYYCKKIIMKYGMSVTFLNVPSTIFELRGSRDNKIELNSHCLILDDFGAHNISNWTLEILYHIIDQRLKRRQPTLITSNINPTNIAAHFKKVGGANVSPALCDALMDRIFQLNFPIFEVTGKSIRLDNCVKEIRNSKKDM